MKNGYEYYYLFGLDLNLEKYGLGILKQPRLIDFLEKNIDIEGFYTPFIMNDYILGQSKDKESFEKVKEQIGSLSFLFMTCYQSSRVDVINSILECVSFLYGAEAKIGDSLSVVVGDVVITNDNFDTLSNVVLEMMKIDKSKIKFDKPAKKEMTELEKEFERRRKEYFDKINGKDKKKGMSTIDIVNALCSYDKFSYKDVLNMTMYQVKNSFETMNIKESFDIATLYRVSPKFDTSKEKFEHWTEKIRLDKSTLSQND